MKPLRSNVCDVWLLFPWNREGFWSCLISFRIQSKVFWRKKILNLCDRQKKCETSVIKSSEAWPCCSREDRGCWVHGLSAHWARLQRTQRCCLRVPSSQLSNNLLSSGETGCKCNYQETAVAGETLKRVLCLSSGLCWFSQSSSHGKMTGRKKW